MDRGLDFGTVDYAGYGAALEAELDLLGDVDGARIAELGCGGAEISIALAKRGADPVGVDLSREQLTVARERVADHGVSVGLARGDVEAPPLPSGSFDAAVSVHALQWVQDVPRFFRAAHRVLREDGRFVVTSTHPFYDCLDEDGRAVWPYDSLHREGEDPNEGLRLTHPPVSDAVEWVGDAGFSLERILEPGPGQRDDEVAELIPPVVIYVADA